MNHQLRQRGYLGSVWKETYQLEKSYVTQREDLKKSDMCKRLKYLQEGREHLRRRWEEEYLAQLRLFQKGNTRPIDSGELVFVVDRSKKRQLWKIGLVTRVFAGKDGRKRVSEVKVENGSFLRPVQLLIPLEVTSAEKTYANQILVVHVCLLFP